MAQPSPSWILKDPGSFTSISVKLPPGASINCESDAVITFSEGVQVKGVMSGGIFGALARSFLTNESFFTTKVENTRGVVADVLLAPSDPGGVILHQMTAGEDMLLTSGAYVASDATIKVTSEMQTKIGNSLLSGTGFFLLRASGRGYLACGAFGSVHRYVLTAGECRSVDNGHLVAWSANMRYWVGLASSGGAGVGARVMNSMTSGEGLMCHFEGPGIVYLQSHKPTIKSGDQARKNAARPQTGIVGACMSLLFFLVFVSILVSTVSGIIKNSELNLGDSGRYNRDYNNGKNRDDEYRGYQRNDEYRGREF